MTNFSAIHRRTPAVYETHAAAWDAQRPRVFSEEAWIDSFLAHVPADGSVLDVGCGAGEPIARYVLERGFALTGVDASQAMVNLCQARFPAQTWLRQDMRTLELPHMFDGIIGWDSFFHLNPDEQRATLSRFCAHLNPGGALLLTVGDEAGEVLGVVNGQAVYHASLAPDDYRATLYAAGFADVTLVLRDPHCDEHSVLLATGYRTLAAPTG